ncbi:ABC transporter ATP-binding protein [Listeria innocua]|uniref:ABC transporter ATP-binding protein n=1 Tax=Listeria innocua TaxID=1642 RepID=UPI001629E478|nr:ABC transporter ATP-binding protein [Listeria innocua]EBF5204562.1 ABC transporter ATP-binding protein [Listeria monocytogenes]MBC2137413.1 ABC transporter ATP-binding protein [Listeria innocua]MBC2140559.1 ABC transporter ATP-binding protein [Listeria innocua]
MKKNIKLKIDHISKQFKEYTALNDINFEIGQGQIVGFLGPSGAGKTTTIKIVTGQLKQTSGNATILGMDSRKINQEIYKRIGIVSDNSGFYEKLSVYENLRFFARLLDVPIFRVDELLEQVGLSEHKKKKASKLSRGQGQRLILARAILHKPEILFLDEPTSGVDPAIAEGIHKLLLALKEEGMAVFLTTHNMNEATKLCDKVALINKGKVVEFGSPDQLCLKYNQDLSYDVLLRNGEFHRVSQQSKSITQVREWLDSDQIETIHSNEPSLEKVFLAVTGEELI